VLSGVLQLWQFSPSTGSAINDGYEFIWHHSNTAIAGDDGIKVVVADQHTVTTTCTAWTTQLIGGKPIRVCTKFQTTTSDTPYVSSGFRLWRSLSGTNGSIQPAGTTSIDAVTAASALPPGVNITAYRSGLWLPGPETSSGVGARSAWIFTLNGVERVAVDAYTGRVLGSTSDCTDTGQ
jgi:hypothetical protein